MTAESGDRDRKAAAELLPLVYRELRALAHARMAGLQSGQTLQPTALVHEAYLKLTRNSDPGWDGRNHFFGAAAQAMREILVDLARRRAAVKHGGGRQRMDLGEVAGELSVTDDASWDTLLAVDEAVKRLEAEDPRKGTIVNLRYFAGMTNEQTAAALDPRVSVGTVEREWRYIRAWLERELAGRGE